MRKTKIVCTLGPASTDYETIKEMALAGMNVVRINMSHGTYEEHAVRINNVKRVREELNIPIALLLDTKGPELRICCFKDGCVKLREGQEFILTTSDVLGDERQVSVSYKGLIDDVEAGDSVYLNNALIELKVKEKRSGCDIVCEVVGGGPLSDKKSLNVPGKQIKLPYLSEADKRDLLFAIEHDFDFIAASFVCSAKNIAEIRDFLEQNSSRTDIIAKIENAQGVKNAKEIIEASDGIMIARGDLGVEIPFEEIPFIQKALIKEARQLGKRVITATEMLESMAEKPRPTRAETSDVGNAVYDETSAVMLSVETAAGKYPVEAIKAMSSICSATEKHINYSKRFKQRDVRIKNVADAISHSTCNTAIDLDARAIAVFTRSGMTARMVSRFRPPNPIIGITDNIKAYYQLALSWGIQPVLTTVHSSTDELFKTAVKVCKERKIASKGDIIVIAAGVPVGKSGLTNLIKVEEIK
jgi:pyruvate kinase